MAIGILAAGTQGGDSNSVCSIATAKALAAAGVKFLIRYVSRTVPNHTGDLSLAERQDILAAGIAVGYVQHYPGNGWAPSLERGMSYGSAAVANLRAIGATPGVCVWRDWEGLLAGSSNAACIADINAWNAEVVMGGYVPGIYVGYNDILDSTELYWRLTCRHYWKSASTVPAPEHRGWQMIQSLAPSPIQGYDWDRDVCITDNLGGAPIWDLP